MAFKYIGERFSKVDKKGSSIGKQAMPLAMHIFYSNRFKQGYIEVKVERYLLFLLRPPKISKAV